MEQDMSERTPDPFGLALWSTHSGQPADVILECRNGAVFTDQSQKYFSSRITPPVKKSLDFLHGKVLDIGCGPGRFALYAQALGYQVDAVDSSWLATCVAKERGVHHTIWSDIWAYLRESEECMITPYDTVLMLGNNLSLLGGLKEGRERLRLLHRVTSERAFVIGDCVNPDCIDPTFLHSSHRSFPRAVLTARLRFLKETSSYIRLMFYTEDEFARLVKGTGWEIHARFHTKHRDTTYVLQKT